MMHICSAELSLLFYIEERALGEFCCCCCFFFVGSIGERNILNSVSYIFLLLARVRVRSLSTSFIRLRSAFTTYNAC